MTAFVTLSVSWELCNVVLPVVKALSFRDQEMKCLLTNFMTGQPLFLTDERFTHAQTVNLKRRHDALVLFPFKIVAFLYFGVLENFLF